MLHPNVTQGTASVFMKTRLYGYNSNVLLLCGQQGIGKTTSYTKNFEIQKDTSVAYIDMKAPKQCDVSNYEGFFIDNIDTFETEYETIISTLKLLLNVGKPCVCTCTDKDSAISILSELGINRKTYTIVDLLPPTYSYYLSHIVYLDRYNGKVTNISTKSLLSDYMLWLNEECNFYCNYSDLIKLHLEALWADVTELHPGIFQLTRADKTKLFIALTNVSIPELIKDNRRGSEINFIGTSINEAPIYLDNIMATDKFLVALEASESRGFRLEMKKYNILSIRQMYANSMK